MYIKNELKINALKIINAQKRFPEHQCNVVAKKRNAESNSVTNFYSLTCLWYSFIGPTEYGLVWNFSKNLRKSSAECAWQTTINKDSTLIRNQKPSSNDRDRNVYLAFLLRQRQGTILVMFESVMHVLEYVWEKRRNNIAHIHSRWIRWQEVIGMKNFAKEVGINNPEIAR